MDNKSLLSTHTVFLLGATGYLGSQFLVLLGKDSESDFQVVALVREPTAEKEEALKGLGVCLSIVKGTLDDDKIIQEEAAKADIVVNCASSDHPGAVNSILAGLEEASSCRLGNPPLYIHISGMGIISDNSGGEYVELDDLPKPSDVGLDLDACPPTNLHLDSDKLIVAAGTREEKPIKSIILFPGWIFGVGEGIQRTTTALRILISIFQKAGHAGTWGKGQSRMGNIHVKDCANAILTVLKAALEGKADEGSQGFYFVTSDEPPVQNREIASRMGDIMFSKGLLPRGGSQPLPHDILDPLGHFGWSLLGSNLIATPERLKRLGWSAVETKKKGLLDSLPEEMTVALALECLPES